MDNKTLKSRYLASLLTSRKTPYLFIGSGFTKRYCKSALSWEELLNSLAETIGISKFQFQSLRISLEKENTPGVVNQKIASYLNGFLQSQIQIGEISEVFTEEEQQYIINNKVDPFKFLIKNKVAIDAIPDESNFINEKYKINELKLFKKLKSNIPGIITTNYDSLIELLFDNEYKTFIKQSDYFYSENYNYAEIYKIHGCVSNPNTLIITEEDYINFNQKSFLTTSKLLQILSNNPIIFIGYSLNDEDIKEIINNLLSCLDTQQIKSLEKNLLFINWEYHVRIIKESTSEFLFGNKRINIPTITTDNFTFLFNELSKFKATISPAEIRRYQSALIKMINSNSKKLSAVFTNINIDNENIDDNQRYVSSIGLLPKSETKYTNKDIINNYLLEKQKFPKGSVLNWTKSYFNYKSWVPLYFYTNVEKETCLIKFKEHKKKQIDTLESKYKKIKTINKIEELESETKTPNKLKIIINSLLKKSLDFKKAKKYIINAYKNDKNINTVQEFPICVTIISKLESEQKNRASK